MNRPTYFVVSAERLSVVENVITGLEVLKEHGRRHRGRQAVLQTEDGTVLAQIVPASTWVPPEEAWAS